jgi:hypothetical protein
MMEYIEELMSRYKGKGLLVDTNLLLVYFVGMYDPERVSKFKRTQTFTEDEFLLLARFFAVFEKLITTPNVLTEVSNLLGQLPNNLRSVFFVDFAKRLVLLEEHYSSSADISTTTHFDRLGLTDSGIAQLVEGRYLVLTDDLSLYGFLQNRGIDAVNFNHIRQSAWVN